MLFLVPLWIQMEVPASEYNAQVQWGDGTISTVGDGELTIVPIANSPGAYDILGNHTYNSSGNFNLSISLEKNYGPYLTQFQPIMGNEQINVQSISGSENTFNIPEGQSQINNTVIASFTDPYPGDSASNLTATVNWGDGNVNLTNDGSGHLSIVADPNTAGEFDVVASHTYAESSQEAGPYTLSVSVKNPLGITYTFQSTEVGVFDTPLIAQPSAPITELLGTPLNNVIVANFTDTNPLSNASDFTATIDWGNGAVTNGVVVADGGSKYSVEGSFQYTSTGSNPILVSVFDNGGQSLSVANNDAIQNVVNVSAALSSASIVGDLPGGQLTEFANIPFSAELADFTFTPSDASINGFSAVVNWGDNSSSTVTTFVSNGQGGYQIGTDHTYTSAGSYPITIDLFYASGTSPVAILTSESINVQSSPINVTFQPESAVVNGSTNPVLLTFTDPKAGPNDVFTDSVNWGDGIQTSVTLSYLNGQGSLEGGHTYTAPGTYQVTVTLTDTTNGIDTTTVSDNIIVGGQITVTAPATTLTPVEGTTLSNVEVATFTDSDPNFDIANLNATISWGDGNSTNGTISKVAGQYEVLGSYTYSNAATDQISVTIMDNAGNSFNDSSSPLVANVATAPYTLTNASITMDIGGALQTTTPIGSITLNLQDPNATVLSQLVADYSNISINWGDGTPTDTQSGSIQLDSSGNPILDIYGQHTFLNTPQQTAGTTDNVTITLTQVNNPTPLTIDSTINLVAPTLVANSEQSVTLNGSEGNPLIGAGKVSLGPGNGTGFAQVGGGPGGGGGNGIIVGSFSDNGGGASDYTVVIDWGDGSQSIGTVVENSAGGTGGNGFFSLAAGLAKIGGGQTGGNTSDVTYNILGSHTYAEEGNYTVKETVTEIDNPNTPFATITNQAQILDLGEPNNLANNLQLNGTINSQVSGIVAQFTDPDATGPSGFSAAIDWGDGTTSTTFDNLNDLKIVADATPGVWDVIGTHTYTQSLTTNAQVTISDADANFQSLQESISVKVAGLQGSTPVNPIQYTNESPFTGTVAHFTDADGNTDPSIYFVTFFLSDGTFLSTSDPSGDLAVLTNPNGGFDVVAENVAGTHILNQLGSESYSLNILDNNDRDLLILNGSINVNPIPLNATSETGLSVDSTYTLNGQLAYFTDPNPQTMQNFTASVSWGDGKADTSGDGLVSIVPDANGIGFDVMGQHHYGAITLNGNPIAITISDDLGAQAQVNDQVAIPVDTSSSVRPVSDTVTTSLNTPFVIATFTDTIPGHAPTDFNVFTPGIYNSVLSVVADPTVAGQFDVLATASQVGSTNEIITITDIFNNDTATVVSNVTVTNPLSPDNIFAIPDISTQVGQQLTTGVAAFNDTDSTAQLSDFVATINWGDGATSSTNDGLNDVTISPEAGQAGQWIVAGTHTYLSGNNANDPITVTLQDTHDGANIILSQRVALVQDGIAINPAQNTVQLTASYPTYSGVVSTFTDPNPNDSPNDLSAIIQWGDNSESLGIVTFTNGVNGSGGFTISGTHTYAVPQGPYSGTAELESFVPSVTINQNGATAGNGSGPTIAIFPPSNTITATFDPITPVAGVPITDSDHIATINETLNNPISQATLNWGDGTTSSTNDGIGDLTLLGSLGTAGIDVVGDHNYVNPGNYTLTLTVLDSNGNYVSAQEQVIVDSNIIVTEIPTTINAVEGTPTPSTEVATFTDANLGRGIGDIATIDWGNGITTTGTIQRDPNNSGVFDVFGSYAYPQAGSYQITVSITDNVNYTYIDSNLNDAGIAQVTPAPIISNSASVTPVSGGTFTGTIATIADTNQLANQSTNAIDPNTLSQDFNIGSIDWGDGSALDTSSAVVQFSGNYDASGNPIYDIVGSHDYQQPAGTQDTITISYLDQQTGIRGLGGGGTQTPLTIVSQATIVDPTLVSESGAAINGSEGNNLSNRGISIGTFSDNGGGSSDYTVAINWGDGTPIDNLPAGSLNGIQNGSTTEYFIDANHSYAQEGNYNITSTVYEVDNPSVPFATIDSTAQISDLHNTSQTNPISGSVNTPLTTVLATFTDPDGNASEFNATINWGDGTPSSSTSDGLNDVTIVAGYGGQWQVVGTHTYTQVGNENVNIIINDTVSNESLSQSQNITVISLSGTTPASVVDLIGSPLPNNGLVATLADGDGNADPTAYTVSINWADGTTASTNDGLGDLTVSTDPNGGFDINTNRTFSQLGTDSYTINISDNDGDHLTLNGSILVNPLPLNVTSENISATAGTQLNGALLAYFTDPNPEGATTAFNVVVNWGDGTSDVNDANISVAPDSSGIGWDVLGTHTYLASGTYSVAFRDPLIVIVGETNAPASQTSVNDQVNVADNPNLPIIPTSTTAAAFVGDTMVVATFTDSNPILLAGDFTATDTIDPTLGTLQIQADSNQAGVFDVLAIANTNEANIGRFATTITIADDVSSADTAYVRSTIDVQINPLNATNLVKPFTVQEGTPIDAMVVGNFTDSNSSDQAGDFDAIIDWGDGTPTTLALIQVDTANGGFDVLGSHTYQYGQSDNYLITISVQDQNDGGASINAANGEAIITNVHVSEAPISAVPVQPIINLTTADPTFSGALATFTDANPFEDINPNSTPSDLLLTARIDWTDTSQSVGIISYTNGTDASGGFTISGSHTFSNLATNYFPDIQIMDNGVVIARIESPQIEIFVNQSTVGTISGSLNNATPVEGKPYNNIVGDFTDTNSDPNATYAATIDWGNGTQSQGIIAPDGAGGFTVSGSNTYAEEGIYAANISISDSDGNTGTVAGNISVADAPLTNVAIAPVPILEGQTLNEAVAHFTDANAGATASDFSALITWSDGTTSVGLVQANGSGFDVIGTKGFADEGSYAVNVAITDKGGSTAQASNTITVNDAPLTNVPIAPAPILEGQTLNEAVAHFTDANAGATAADFSALITWSDGTTSVGLVQANGSGFDVIGTKAFADEGSYAVNVAITDKGGSTAQASNTITVNDAPLTNVPIATAPILEGQTLNEAVAHFTDANAGATAADFSALITWSDGTTSVGLVQANGSGFDVIGTKAFADEGSYAVNVAITDKGGSTAQASNTIAVNDAPLTNVAIAPAPILEGQTLSEAVAHFTDANAGATAADFSALITWSDGTTSVGLVQANGNGFDVIGTKAFADEGSYTVNVAITDKGGSTAQASNTITVNDAPLTNVAIAPAPIVEGQTLNEAVAHFTDANAGATAADFSALITWSDGTTSAGLIQANGSGFDVIGTKAFADEGSYTVNVAITDKGGSTAQANNTITVNDAPLTNVTVAPAPIVEGQTLNEAVAHFTDANAGATAADFSALITWSDGTTSVGLIQANGSGFDVIGTKAFTDEGSYAVNVAISDKGGSTAQANNIITVKDAALTAQSINAITGIEGAQLSGVAVARFTDANLAAPLSDYTATISWGDGSTSSGTFAVDPNGGVDVIGSHTYGEAGTKGISVTINDKGGANVNATNNASISEAPINATGQVVSAVEGSVFSGPVATFTDGNPGNNLADLTATITWDGSTTTAGSITYNNGTYTVSGAHTYAEEGNQAISIKIYDAGALMTSTTATATIADAPITATGDNISPTVNVAFNGAVATFHDANINAPLGDFSATITWGDSSTSAGVIVSNGGGNFTVDGAHTYLNVGTNSIQVSILDIGSAHATVTGIANVVGSLPINANSDSYHDQINSNGSPIQLAVSALNGVLANDTNSNSLALTAQIVSTTSHGNLHMNADGSFNYTPNAGFTGVDSFTYRDVSGNSVSNTVTDTIVVDKNPTISLSGQAASYTQGQPNPTTISPTASVAIRTHNLLIIQH